MDEHDWLAERFEEHRPHLRAVAYRLLGSLSEAEDAVQDAWLRLSRADTSGVANLGGWLTTVVARVCLNMLQARKSRREEPLGAHGPEPLVCGGEGTDPEHEAMLADAVGPALLVVLDTLAPGERVAFVLHDVFAVPFEEIAPIVGRSPAAGAAARQPRPPPGAGRGHGARRRSHAPAHRGRRLPRGRAAGTSMRCSRCSTPTSCSGQTPQPCRRAQRRRSAVQRPWPPPSRGGPGSPNRRS